MIANEHQAEVRAAQIFRRYRLKGLIVEWALVVVLTGLASLVSVQQGLAIFLGGAVYALPNAVFTLMGLRHIGDTESARILVSMAVGFVGKMLFIGIGLALVFTHFEHLPAATVLLSLIFFYLLGLLLTGFLSSRAAKAAEEAKYNHGV